MPEQPKVQLPSPLAVFGPDPAEARIRRVAEVERFLLETYGPLHVPDQLGRPRYFALEIDATVQRRLAARRQVEYEERLARFDATMDAAFDRISQTAHQLAERQRRIYEETGELTIGDGELA